MGIQNIQYFLLTSNKIQRHLILGMSFSYFLGWLGFHFSWVVLLFYIVYQFEKEREERVWHRKLEEYEKKKKEMERKTKLVQTKERIEWFNTLFHKLWPKMGPFMVETTQKTTKNIIEKTLDQLKPPVVVNKYPNFFVIFVLNIRNQWFFLKLILVQLLQKFLN